MAAAYFLELALDENSAAKMTVFFLFLYLALLTHFSAILFAGAVGVYSVWRLLTARPSRRVVSIWIAGQAGVLWLLVFLYATQISRLKAGSSAEHMQVLLANSYFRPGHDRLFGFIFARTFGVLQYTFGQLAVGEDMEKPEQAISAPDESKNLPATLACAQRTSVLQTGNLSGVEKDQELSTPACPAIQMETTRREGRAVNNRHTE